MAKWWRGEEFAASEGYPHGERCGGAGDEGGEPCSKEAEIEGEDEEVVEDEVENVASYHDPHGSESVTKCIRELLHGVEKGHEGEGDEKDDEVRTDKGKKLLRLSEVVDVEIEEQKKANDEEADKKVDPVAFAQGLESFREVVLTVKACHNGSGGVGDAKQEIDAEVKYVIDKTGSRELGSAVLPHHDSICPSQEDTA